MTTSEPAAAPVATAQASSAPTRSMFHGTACGDESGEHVPTASGVTSPLPGAT